MIHIVGKLRGVDVLRSRFHALPGVIDKGMASGLNKLGAQGLTAANKGIRETYNIKAGDVRKGLSRVPAKASYGGRQPRLWTTIIAKAGRIGLHKFGGLPTTPMSQKGIAVASRKMATVKILKQGTRRQVTRDTETGNRPFVARMRGGFGGSEVNHVGVFVRTSKWLAGNKWRGGKVGSKHQVIRELKSKGIAESFASQGRAALDELVRSAKAAGIMEHEIKQAIERAERGGR